MNSLICETVRWIKLEFVGKVMTVKIIIYGSKYGTTKQYAEELARKTGIDLKCYEDVTDINRYNIVCYNQ